MRSYIAIVTLLLAASCGSVSSLPVDGGQGGSPGGGGQPGGGSSGGGGNPLQMIGALLRMILGI